MKGSLDLLSSHFGSLSRGSNMTRHGVVIVIVVVAVVGGGGDGACEHFVCCC